MKPLSEEEAKKLDQECLQRFIKVNVKHITDGQVSSCSRAIHSPNKKTGKSVGGNEDAKRVLSGGCEQGIKRRLVGPQLHRRKTGKFSPTIFSLFQ